MTGSIAASGNIMSLLDESCKSVTLPGEYCFYCLFYGCDVLTAGPELPAATLLEYCYFGMFLNCHNLNSITVYFTDWNTSDNSTGMWVYSVADSGTFRCPSALVHNPPIDGDFGDDYVPRNATTKWKVETF